MLEPIASMPNDGRSPSTQGMDRPRPPRSRRRLIGVAVFGALALVLGGTAIARLGPSLPRAERSAIVTATVVRGDMRRDLRAPGTLVPETLRLVTARSEATVVRVCVEPGTTVTEETVLVELENPELQAAAADTEIALRSAESEAKYKSLSAMGDALDREVALAGLDAQIAQGKFKLESDDRLAAEGMISGRQRALSELEVEALVRRRPLEQQRIALAQRRASAVQSVEQAKLEQLRATLEMHRSKLKALEVRAGASGVLRELTVEVGQRVSPDTTVAKVIDPSRLKAVARVPESLARDLAVGQAVAVDVSTEPTPGKVARIDPAVQNGTVGVDIAFDERLPKGTRPDLSVMATIEIERLPNVRNVRRPTTGRDHAETSVFKLSADGQRAERVQVRFGAASVHDLAIEHGLSEGDVIIVSDTSSWERFDQLRIVD